MTRRARSARGVIVDFDLLQIKEQIGAKAPTLDVKMREDFIDKKLKRRIRRAKNKIERPASQPTVAVDVDQPVVVESDEQRSFIDAAQVRQEKKNIKQKARPEKIEDNTDDDTESNP